MESSPSPALISPLSDHKLAMEKLIKGRDLARELQHILNNPRESHGLDSPGILVERVIGSFVDAISALNDSVESPETSSGSKLTSTLIRSLCSEDQVVEHSSECRTIPANKKGRRAYKRSYRKTSEAWSLVTATPLDDGHGWRKYGQKDIQGAKHPRSYFRCTHSHDQNCEASKQVQQMEDDSSMYLIKYIGKHTCRDPHLQPPHPIILDYSTTPKEKCLLNFQSTDHLIMIKEEEHYSNQPSFFSTFTSMKQDEYNNPFLGHLLHYHKGNSASSNSALPASEEKSFASSVSSIGFPAMEYSDLNEILSRSVCSVTSSPILKTGTMVGSISFEDMFDEELLAPI